jgi:hypothetical protein
MRPLDRQSFKDCAHQHLYRSRIEVADPNNLFHLGGLLSRSHDEVLHAIGRAMHRKGTLHDVRTQLLNLAADALVMVDAIDAAAGHVGAILLEPSRTAA